MAEAQKHGEIKVYWIPGTDNPSDLFTKEHRDLNQFCKCRDLMVRPREWIHEGCPDVPNDHMAETAKARKREDKKARRMERLHQRALTAATQGPIYYIGNGVDMPIDLREDIDWCPFRTGEVGGVRNRVTFTDDGRT